MKDELEIKRCLRQEPSQKFTPRGGCGAPEDCPGATGLGDQSAFVLFLKNTSTIRHICGSMTVLTAGILLHEKRPEAWAQHLTASFATPSLHLQ